MPRAPGRIAADGVRASAEVLVAALRAPQRDHDVAESLTHPFHGYPARLHPVVDAASFAPGVHQAGVFQGGQMLRDRRLRDVEARGEVFHGRFASGQ